MSKDKALKIDIGIDGKSRKGIADGLCHLLADEYTLYLKTHNFHWNVTGTMFNTLHLMFETQYTEAALAVDLVAEDLAVDPRDGARYVSTVHAGTVLKLDATGSGVATLRSDASLGTSVRVDPSQWEAEPLTVTFRPPYWFICAAILGGLLGAFLRGKGRRKWSMALAIGVASAILMVIGYRQKHRAFSGEVNGGINLLGNMFNYQGPMLWTVSLIHDSASKPDDIVNAMESVIAPLRTKPVDQALLDRALIKFRSNLYDNLSQLNGFGRADMLASFALFDDNPSRINDIETQLRKVTPALIQKTATEYLRPDNRTVLVVETKPAEPAGNKPGN